jgi:hypothetical protein
MKREERYDLEKEMQDDPFMEDALEGLSMVDEQKAKEDILRINQKIRGTRQASNRSWITGMAAGLALLLIASIGYLAVERVKDSFRETQVTHEHQTPQPTEFTDSLLMDEKSSQKEDSTLEDLEIKTPTPAAPQSAAATQPIKKEVKSTTVQEKQVEDIIHPISQPAERPDAGQPPMAGRVSEISALRNETSAAMLMERGTTIEKAVSGNIIEGRIVDGDDNLPLPGVTVLIKGTNTGTVTDTDGRFKIEIPHDDDITLQANYIGMTSIEFSPADLTGEALIMQPDMLTLSEIVVIGYGTRRSQMAATSASDKELTPAEPIDGYRVFNQYIKENAVLPATSSLSRATVIIIFEIDPSGEPVNFEALRSPDEELSKQAIELIKNGPSWKPASSGGQYLNEPVRVRMVFRKK